MTEDEYTCEHQTYAGSLEQPPEYCENTTVPGEDYCELHMPDDWWEEPPSEYWFEDDLEPFE